MIVALITLAIFNLLQGYVILQLMNRLLRTAKVEPVELHVKQPEGVPTHPVPVPRKPIFTVPVTD